jgi:protein-tyrosine phosphatase
MIDIHSHILPGLDDGARDTHETAAMLQIARETGATGIAATPHADTQYRYDVTRVEALLDAARAQAPEGLALYRGCDFHLMHDNIIDALAHPTRYTINGGRYLLVELSDLVIFHNTGELFGRLEQAGMTIIVTHPERNPLLRQRLELIEEWVAQGRLMQVTAGSLTGQWGPKALEFSRALLDRGLVHFIASDGHDPEHRPPRLDLARAWMEQHYPPALALRLFEDHPRAVVENRPIDLAGFPPRKSVATKGGFWSRLLGRAGAAPADRDPEP